MSHRCVGLPVTEMDYVAIKSNFEPSLNTRGWLVVKAVEPDMSVNNSGGFVIVRHVEHNTLFTRFLEVTTADD
jgi:hypothetical protein